MKRFLSLWERLVRTLARLIGVASLTLGIFIYATSSSIFVLVAMSILAVTTFFRWWPAMTIVTALSVVAVFVVSEPLFAIVAVTYAMFGITGGIASRARTEARVARRLARKARTQN